MHCTYIFEELGMIQLIESVDGARQRCAGCIDGSVELSHGIVNEVRAGKHIVLHVVHLLAESLVMAEFPLELEGLQLLKVRHFTR